MIEEKEISNNDFFERLKVFRSSKLGRIIIRVLIAGLAYLIYSPIHVESDELVELKITTSDGWTRGGKNNSIKIFFRAKEYPCKFGINVGGTYGRWDNVTSVLQENNTNIIAIKKSSYDNLNSEGIVVPIYYLENSEKGLIFNENDFNAGEQSASNNYRWVILVVFLASFWEFKKT